MGHYNMSTLNKGRMANLGSAANDSSSGTYDPGILAEKPPAPVQAPATTAPPLPTPSTGSAPVSADPAEKATKVKKKPDPPAKKTKRSKSDECEADKEKYSIYLSQKLSLSMRMVCITTRKKFSHLIETALGDMLYNRYQCENPGCNVRFTMSETDTIPCCCPACGGKKFSPLRLDIV